MTTIDPTAPRRPGGALLACLLALARATTASGAAPFVCPDGGECKKWNDGCNECSLQEDGSEVCTKKLCDCSKPGSCVPVCNDNKECVPDAGPAPKSTRPLFECPGGAACKSWNDGCNTCGVQDGAEVCTEKYCTCLDTGSCPPPKCLDEGCTLIEADPPGMGGNLQGMDDGSMCPAIWEPVCGSDGLVYSNACEADANQQEVQYVIQSPDSVFAGKKCPAEAEKPSLVEEDCGTMSACVDCVEAGCAWTADMCMTGCMVADVSCYMDNGENKEPAAICQAEVDEKADAAACNLKTCGECVATALPSDGTRTCMWFDMGEDMSYCGSACGMAGCGETECRAAGGDASEPAPGKGDEDAIICPDIWEPVCGSDGRVYSNKCDAGANEQAVQYVIESPDESLTAGDECPGAPEKAAPNGEDTAAAAPENSAPEGEDAAGEDAAAEAPESSAEAAPEGEDAPEEEEDPVEENSAGDGVGTRHRGLLLVLSLAFSMLV